MEDDVLPPYAEELIEGEPNVPLDAPRERRTCIIEDVWDEGSRYIGLRVKVDGEFREAYTTPGQYVTLSPTHVDPRFLVIANAPGEPSEHGWEFLVDRHTDLGESIDPLSSGETLEISAPEGPGYPVDDLADARVICFVTGSGIASIRPVLQYWWENPEIAPADISLYYGESNPGDHAYRSESADWARKGVDIFHCNGSGAEEGYRYVQHAFEDDAPDLDEAVAFIAGAPVMKRAVVDLLVAEGLPIGRVVTNI